MTLKLVATSQFKKDYKRVKKRGLDISELHRILDKLRCEEPLEERHRDHALVGTYEGFHECHIRPDWLLIYAINKGQLVLIASRAVTHSDLLYVPLILEERYA